jgi:lambda family phage portal protein
LKLRDKILRRFGYYPVSETVKLVKRYAGKRGYEGAGGGRFLSSWTTANREIDVDLRTSRTKIMARVRDLEKNNDLVKGAIIVSNVNVVGPNGFLLQSRVVNDDGSYDELANKQIEEKFKEWSRREYCSLDKRLSFLRLQMLANTCVKRDGEFIARIIKGNYASKGLVNKFGIALQPLDSADLDETYNDDRLSNGNIIKMGVELDNETREHVAYWIKTRTARQELSGGSAYTRVRIPADEIVFAYDLSRARQTRGISAFAQSLIKLHQLKEWEDSAVINAIASAKKLGFITQSLPEGTSFDLEDVNTDGNMLDRMESGEIEYLDPYQDFKTWDPQYPSDQHGPFVKEMKLSIAAGLGMSYGTLTGDLLGSSYSSMRIGTITERDVWMMEQALLIEMFLEPVFKAWLQMAIMTRQLNLPYSKFEKFNKPQFVGRRWKWVDPKNDIEAMQLEYDMGITSKSEIAGTMGKDYEDVLKERQKDKEKELKYGYEEPLRKEPATTINLNRAQEDEDDTNIIHLPGVNRG